MGNGSQAVYAVEAKTGGGYTIAIKESFEGSSDSNWQTIDTDDEGVIDWSTEYWGNIKGKETLFNQDLDGDESTGIENHHLLRNQQILVLILMDQQVIDYKSIVIRIFIYLHRGGFNCCC